MWCDVIIGPGELSTDKHTLDPSDNLGADRVPTRTGYELHKHRNVQNIRKGCELRVDSEEYMTAWCRYQEFRWALQVITKTQVKTIYSTWTLDT